MPFSILLLGVDLSIRAGTATLNYENDVFRTEKRFKRSNLDYLKESAFQSQKTLLLISQKGTILILAC